MKEIDDFTNVIIGLCSGGCVLRIIVLFIQMSTCEPEEQTEKKSKIKNTLIFGILAVSIFSVKTIISAYFS